MATTYERVDYGSDDGAQFGGASTDKIGFYGATPVVRPTATTTQTTVTTTAASSTNAFGFTTSTQANDIVTQLNAAKTDINGIRALLATLGLSA